MSKLKWEGCENRHSFLRFPTFLFWTDKKGAHWSGGLVLPFSVVIKTCATGFKTPHKEMSMRGGMDELQEKDGENEDGQPNWKNSEIALEKTALKLRKMRKLFIVLWSIIQPLFIFVAVIIDYQWAPNRGGQRAHEFVDCISRILDFFILLSIFNFYDVHAIIFYLYFEKGRVIQKEREKERQVENIEAILAIAEGLRSFFRRPRESLFPRFLGARACQKAKGLTKCLRYRQGDESDRMETMAVQKKMLTKHIKHHYQEEEGVYGKLYSLQ